MPVRPAVDTLRQIRNGGLMSDLDIQINDLVRQIRKTDKAGSITLKIDIKPVSGDASTVTVKDTLTVKAPQMPTPETTFFTTVDANLSRNDPSQPELNGIVSVDTDKPLVNAVDDDKKVVGAE